MSTKHTQDDELEWRIIKDYPNYEVSNDGQVRRGTKLLKSNINPYGYKVVNLYNDTGVKNTRVHRLVLSAFTSDCPENMICCHNDGNKLNNNLTNLRWDTHKSNYWDARKHGTASIHDKHGSAKLTLDLASEIRKRIQNGEYERALAREYGVNSKTIFLIKIGKTWVTDEEQGQIS